MKRELILFSILFLIIAFFPIVLADETSQINDAYSCLKSQINSTGCDSLSTEQKAFSLLSVGECNGELINDSYSEECWPGGNCNLKTTAQAILALTQFNSNYNSTLAENWLLSNTKIPENLNWFLEIETTEPSTCTIYYTGEESGISVNIDSEKKLSSSRLGNCLTLAKNDYLLEVSPECFNMEIDISCNKNFLTTLLFQMQDSTTINVLDEVHESSASGTTTEKINSLCFKNSANQCDYDGSLWASEVLFSLDNDVSEFLPYLVAFSEDNQQLLPWSFLYYLTGNFRTELLSKQVRNKYWIVSGDEYYDTALALLPLQNENPIEKSNSKNWLLSVQEESGCWDNNNLRNTAFILYSIWPRNFNNNPDDESVCGDGQITGSEECDGTNLNGESCVSLGYDSGNLTCRSPDSINECQFNENNCVLPDTCETDDNCPDGYLCSASGKCYKDTTSDYECDDDSDCKSDEECTSSHICVEKSLDCKDEGYFCMSGADCDGEILSEYDCSSVLFKCCSVEKSYGTCYSQDGKICDTDTEYCDGSEIDADNLISGEVCCLGTCKDSTNNQDDYTCEINSGTCRTSCLDSETESSYYDCEYGDACCFSKDKKGNKWILWVLIILILLVVLGIVFREKIRDFIMKMKHKMKKSPKGPDSKRPLFRGGLKPIFPSQPQNPNARQIPRRILPPSQMPQKQNPKLPPKKPTKTSKDLDEVLKKLRDMGK